MDTITVPKPKEIAVTLKASSFFYDDEADAYRVKFAETQLISNSNGNVILLIPSSKVQSNSQTQCLKDEDIDSILDEIAAKEKHKKRKKEKKALKKAQQQQQEEKEREKNKNSMISTSDIHTATNTMNTRQTKSILSSSNYHTPDPSEFVTKSKSTKSIKSHITNDSDNKQREEHDDNDMIISQHGFPHSSPSKLNNSPSQKEKLAAKLASIPKPRKQAKIDIEPNKPRPRSPVASARSNRSSKTYKTTTSRSPRRESTRTSRRSSKRTTQDKRPENVPDLEATKFTATMKSEWLTCCNNDVSDDECKGDEGAGCAAMKRVKFVLEHYSSWMEYKSFKQTDDDSSDGDSSDGDESGADIEYKRARLMMRSYPWIGDFFQELGGYSYVELSDDFEHIRDFHMKLNKNKTSQTIEYFDSLLGKCKDKECPCLARHCRDRHIDNINEKKRRQIFFY